MRHLAGGQNLSAEFQTQKPSRSSKVCAEEVQLADANDLTVVSFPSSLWQPTYISSHRYQRSELSALWPVCLSGCKTALPSEKHSFGRHAHVCTSPRSYKACPAARESPQKSCQCWREKKSENGVSYTPAVLHYLGLKFLCPPHSLPAKEHILLHILIGSCKISSSLNLLV